MFEFFGHLGGLWFLLFTAIIILAGVVAAEFDSVIGAVITYILMFAGFYFWFDFPFDVSMFDSIVMIVIGVIGYVGVGLVYGIPWRYRNWLLERSDDIKDSYNRFCKHSEDKSTKTFRNSSYNDDYRPKRNLDRITAWIALWPWALAWDCCHRPVRFVYNTTYDIAAKMLDAVSDKVTDNILK